MVVFFAPSSRLPRQRGKVLQLVGQQWKKTQPGCTTSPSHFFLQMIQTATTQSVLKCKARQNHNCYNSCAINNTSKHSNNSHTSFMSVYFQKEVKTKITSQLSLILLVMKQVRTAEDLNDELLFRIYVCRYECMYISLTNVLVLCVSISGGSDEGLRV